MKHYQTNFMRGLILIFLSISSLIFAEQPQPIGRDKTNRLSTKFIKDNSIVSIKIERQEFDPSNHRLSQEHWKIDGTTPLGVDGFEVNPQTEISTFTVVWNGNPIPIPIQMYRDCYSPCLKVADIKKYIGKDRKRGEAVADEGITVRWDETDSMLEIIMVSYEWAAAPYDVIWKITPYGIHSRTATNLGS